VHRTRRTKRSLIPYERANVEGSPMHILHWQ
jgi:hypothetical protein